MVAVTAVWFERNRNVSETSPGGVVSGPRDLGPQKSDNPVADAYAKRSAGPPTIYGAQEAANSCKK